MKRIPINLCEYAGHILEQLPKGILLSSAANGRQDTMTIGWGTLGTDWSLPIFTVFVRESRFTKTLLDASGEFTLNIPLANTDVRKILGYCGTKSGRDVDKFEMMHLTAVEGEKVQSPAILELPITLECKIIYRQDQNPAAIGQDLLHRYYPTGDFHTAYTGQIVAAYLLSDE